MKLTLTADLVSQMSLEKYPEPDVPYRNWKPVQTPNYVVYDEHRDAPVGFAIRVGKKASVYLVEKLVSGKHMKIGVGLARGRKGSERPLDLAFARRKAHELLQIAKVHGANPKTVVERTEASELTLGQIWDSYLKHLKTRGTPIKPNSEKSLTKARQKLKDWEDRKVRLISADEILVRFDHHAVERGHRTAAEAMGRWATSAINYAIELETHDAHAAHRTPSLTYNPFTILMTNERYRSSLQLERDYARKGIRNPLSFDRSVAPYVQTAWEYRRENPVAADFLLLDLLWGLRGDECRTFKWRDKLSDAEAADARWIDLVEKVAMVRDAKNRGDHEFPIGPRALELLKLRRLDQLDDQLWVFPAKSEKSERGHYSDPSCAMNTVRERAGIKVLRGHDLRRTFGGACEKLGFTDRQVKRMLGHGQASGGSHGRYTTPEWIDMSTRMLKVEDLILSTAPDVYNALRPRAGSKVRTDSCVEVATTPKRVSRRRPR